LGFLGAWPFGRETPVFECWKSLDFLGFSRPNRAFSMSYGGFSLEEISTDLCRSSGGGGMGASGRVERSAGWPRGKLTLASDFQQ
jgi:hypothetical protein